MAFTSAIRMLLDASARGYAVGAFNVTGLPQMLGVVEAAVALRAPVIVQTSVTPSRFVGRDVFVAICRSLAASAPVPICLHLDHCTEVSYCAACAEAGYTNVMIDASRRPLEENIRLTEEVCRHAHGIGEISVEGELGTVSGVEDQAAVVEDAARLCDPADAVQFVERTGVDLFAPAIGTAHGVYATPDPKIDFERLYRIRKGLDARSLKTPLVIHGGTGLPVHTVKKLIELGGAKFNVSTELKHVLVDATCAYVQAHPLEYDPLKIDAAVRDATREAVSFWIELLGCAGKA
jgi:tagatose 1,6-diphosphate aldolase GatY/KbaY